MIAPVLEARFESHVAIDLTGIDALAFTSRLTAVKGFFAELTK